VRRVVFLVNGLVADHGPAGGLDDFDIEALLGIKAQGMRRVEIAAIAVPAPTVLRKFRRVSSCGNNARITADSTARLPSASLSAVGSTRPALCSA
jgi:hypothetical protein